MKNFLQQLVLYIVLFAYGFFLLNLVYNNDFIKGVLNFFEAIFKDQDIGVAIFTIIFAVVPCTIILRIWQKFFHR